MTIKPTIIIYIFSFLFLITGIASAAPVGNPSGPVLLEGNYPTKFSLEAETVLERKMESDTSGNVKFSGMFYTGKVAFYIGRKIDIYGLVGTYEGKVKNFINESYIIDSKMDALVGGGVTCVLHEFEYLRGLVRLGIDAKYRQFEPDIDSVKYYREKIVTTSKAMSFKEWQVAGGLSYQYKNFTPYVGLKYSDMDAKIEFVQDSVTHSDSTVSSKNILGLFYGIDMLVADNISLSIEARNFDEKALNADLNVRF